MRTSVLALAMAAGLAMERAKAAEGPVPTAPAAVAFQLGGLKLVSLADAGFEAPNDGKTFGVGVGPAAVAKVLTKAGLPTDHISVAVDALLLIDKDHVVLLDTGLGPRLHGALQASLAKAGYQPSDITDVLITHSHGDHIGGLLNGEGASAFPKAAIRMSAAEWAWMQTHAAQAALIKAIGPQVKTFEPGAPILPGITPIAIRGHTPGHVGYEIRVGAKRLLDIGDTAHSSVISLAEPEWTIEFDNDAAAGKVSRRTTLGELARTGELVFAPHFPFPGVGHVVKVGNGFAWKPGFQ